MQLCILTKDTIITNIKKRIIYMYHKLQFYIYKYIKIVKEL